MPGPNQFFEFRIGDLVGPFSAGDHVWVTDVSGELPREEVRTVAGVTT